VLMVEMLSQKHRLWVPSIGGWPVALALLSLMAYMTRDWRTLAIVMNVLALPALGLILFLGESPRWLLQSGRTEEALAQLKRVTNMNHIVVDEAHWAALSESKVQRGPGGRRKKYTYWHLFSTKKMALHTIVLSVTFFCLSSVSFGLTFNIDKLSGSIFLNFFYLACLKWIGGLVSIAADTMSRKYGRRVGVILPASLIAVASTAAVVLHVVSPTLPSLSAITRIILLCSAALCSPIWNAMPLANNELFPTPIRNMAVAFCSVFNRLGGVVMPQILYMDLFWKPAPFVAYVVLSVVMATLFAVFIPETKGQPLPQHMPEETRKRDVSATERSDSFTVYKFVNVHQDALLKEQEAA